ncbi:MAG: OsmC family peroxiredoxin [Bacteroidetes bacterium]|nr:MAG: OsmC family peroxiredoxin [Bacteroidota bacterium]
MSEITRPVKASLGKEHYATKLSIGPHQLLGDEPEKKGGGDAGPTPSELLLSALASCILITVRMYADRKEWPLESIEIEVDLAEREVQSDGFHSRIVKKLTLNGNLSEDQIERLMQVSERCPVAKTLLGHVTIENIN